MQINGGVADIAKLRNPLEKQKLRGSRPRGGFCKDSFGDEFRSPVSENCTALLAGIPAALEGAAVKSIDGALEPTKGSLGASKRVKFDPFRRVC